MKCPDDMIDPCPGTGDDECRDCIYLRAFRTHNEFSPGMPFSVRPPLLFFDWQDIWPELVEE